MSTFIFIIPLSPEKGISRTRKKLQHCCFSSLLAQGNKKWKALCIGHSDYIPDSSNFIHIPFEALKREKLAKATRFLNEEEVNFDYLIRLDDDDIFNPSLLSEIESNSFDVFVDKTHHFYNPFEKKVAKKTQYWFPNTYILNKELALQKIESDIPGTINGLTLIEQDHNLHHHFLQNANIQFSEPDSPVYLRSITKESITANNASDINDYLNSFGNWNRLNLKPFNWLKPLDGSMPIEQSRLTRTTNKINEVRYNRNYEKMVFGKKTSI